MLSFKSLNYFRQLFKSILFNLGTTSFRVYEWLRVVLRYYTRVPGFFAIDLLLASQYLFKSPHRISKAFLAACGEANVYQFGETPLTTLDAIARACHILSHDVVYELGCGSGRTCFWLRTFVKCRVTGIDYLPTFILKACYVKKKRYLNQIDFLQEDMLSVDFSDATVIYLYGTCLEDTLIEKLTLHLGCLKPAARVITVSYPLTDYCKGTLFKLTKTFPARFPWGTATIYLNERLK